METGWGACDVCARQCVECVSRTITVDMDEIKKMIFDDSGDEDEKINIEDKKPFKPREIWICSYCLYPRDSIFKILTF